MAGFCVEMKSSVPTGSLLSGEGRPSPASAPAAAIWPAGWQHEWRGLGGELMVRVPLWDIRPQARTHCLCFEQGITMQQYLNGLWYLWWWWRAWWKVTMTTVGKTKFVYSVCTCERAPFFNHCYTVPMNKQRIVNHSGWHSFHNLSMWCDAFEHV